MSAADPRSDRRRRRRRALLVRWGLRLAIAVILFGVGVAVGEALHDNPKPGGAVTSISTIRKP